jgi:adenylate cyclase
LFREGLCRIIPSSFQEEEALFSKRPALRRLALGAFIGAAVATVVAALCAFGVFDVLEYKALDARFKLFPFQPPSKDIVVFVIDEKSLLSMEGPEYDKHGWPWTREVYGRMVAYANLCGARAVVLDLDFSSSFNPQRDEDLGQNLLSNKAIPVYTVAEFKNETEPEFMRMLESRKALIQGKEIEVGGNPDVQEFNSVYPPVRPIAMQVKRIGASNFRSDADGQARHMTLLFRCNGKTYPALSLAAALDLMDVKGIETADGGRTLVLQKSGPSGETRIPLEAGDSFLIKWYDWLKDPKDYSTAVALYYCGMTVTRSNEFVSLMKNGGTIAPGALDLDKLTWTNKDGTVTAGSAGDFPVKPQELKNKIVFIGASASSLADNKSTPVDDIMPGVCVNATATQNILSNDFITRAPQWATIALAAVFSLLTGITCTMLVPGFKRLWVAAMILFALIFVYIAGYSGWAAYNFAHNSLWMDVVPVWAGILVTYAASTTAGYVTESKGKREFKKAFGKYLSPELVEELSKDFGSLSVNTGARQDLTVLFSDIRGFTPMSEKMQPEEVVRLLNEYLSAMVEVIFRNGGFLDKYIGDGIMAIFTAPKRRENHAELAVRAACGMLETIDRMREKWTGEGKHIFDIGIGINSGDMVVGNIGSDKRLDYTAIGDSVNLAARLETLNKQFGTRIIVSEETYSRVRDIVDARDLGTAGVKGKRDEIHVYEVKGLKDKA